MSKLSKKIKILNPKSFLLSIGYRLIFLILAIAVGVGVYGFSPSNFINITEIEPEVLGFLIGGLFVIFSQVDYDGESTEIDFIAWKMMAGTSFLLIVFLSVSYFILNVENIDAGIIFASILSVYMIIFFYIMFGDFNEIISDYTDSSKIKNISSYITVFTPVYVLPGLAVAKFAPQYKSLYVQIVLAIVLFLLYYHSRLATTAHTMRGYSSLIPPYAWLVVPVSGSFYVVISLILGSEVLIWQVSSIVLFVTLAQTVVFIHNSSWKDVEEEKSLTKLRHDIISLLSEISEEEIQIKVFINENGVISNIESIESRIENNEDKIEKRKLKEIKKKIEIYKERTTIID